MNYSKNILIHPSMLQRKAFCWNIHRSIPNKRSEEFSWENLACLIEKDDVDKENLRHWKIIKRESLALQDIHFDY